MTPYCRAPEQMSPISVRPLLEPHLRAIGTSLLRAQCAAWNCAPFARTVPFWRRSTVLRRHSRAAETGARARTRASLQSSSLAQTPEKYGRRRRETRQEIPCSSWWCWWWMSNEDVAIIGTASRRRRRRKRKTRTIRFRVLRGASTSGRRDFFFCLARYFSISILSRLFSSCTFCDFVHLELGSLVYLQV